MVSKTSKSQKKGGKRCSRKMRGGMSTSTWGVQKYGDAAHQQAASNQDNMIAVHGGASANEWGVQKYGGMDQQQPISAQNNAIAVRGGKKRRSSSKGGSLVGELAAPVILLVAQQNYKPRRLSNKFRRNNRRSRSYGRR